MLSNTCSLVKIRSWPALATGSGGIGIFEWDIIGGAVLWDTTMHRLYGIEPAAPAPSLEHWRSLIHPDDVAAIEAAAAGAVETATRLEAEFRIVWPDGSIRYLRVAGHVGGVVAGRAARFIGANWDVTEAR